MSETLYNGFNNGRDASDGVGGQPNPLNEKGLFIELSKKLEDRHSKVRKEMIQCLDAMKLLEDQYNLLKEELEALESQYVDNLKNIIE